MAATAKDGRSGTGGGENAHAHELALAPPEGRVLGRSQAAAQAPSAPRRGSACGRGQRDSAARWFRRLGVPIPTGGSAGKVTVVGGARSY